jgi:Histidine kinase-like ATPase domain
VFLLDILSHRMSVRRCFDGYPGALATALSPRPSRQNPNLISSHGRGIYLMKHLMDEVCFEQGGTVVHMRKSAGENSPRGDNNDEANETQRH